MSHARRRTHAKATAQAKAIAITQDAKATLYLIVSGFTFLMGSLLLLKL